MIHIYRVLNLILLPIFLFTALLFSKKFRKWMRRESNLKGSHLKRIWIHTSSGEFEHAKPLIRKLKEAHPYKKIVVTYSSPSYMEVIKKTKEVDAYSSYPFDLKGPVHSLIKKINPEVVLFTKTDVWPELIHQLNRKKISSIVFARTEAKPLGLLKKFTYLLTFKKVSHISFISAEDQKNYTLDTPKTSVDGDPRIDEVFFKQEDISEQKPFEKSITLGSVWLEDMDVIGKPLLDLLDSNELEKIIVAPHEPTESHIASLQKLFSSHSPSLLSKDEDFLAKVIIVDSVGKLFSMYPKTQVAFVGGSFKKKVHSVIEPLSYGLTVLTGPKYHNNTEAKTFKEKPYEFVNVCHNSKDFKSALQSSLSNPKAEEIKKTVDIFKGSTERVYEIVNDHLT